MTDTPDPKLREAIAAELAWNSPSESVAQKTDRIIGAIEAAGFYIHDDQTVRKMRDAIFYNGFATAIAHAAEGGRMSDPQLYKAIAEALPFWADDNDVKRIIAAIEAVGYACVKPDPPGSVIANVHARGYAEGFAKAIEMAAAKCEEYEHGGYGEHRNMKVAYDTSQELAAAIKALTPPKEGE